MKHYGFGECILDAMLDVRRAESVEVYLQPGSDLTLAQLRLLYTSPTQSLEVTEVEPPLAISLDRLVLHDGALWDRVSEREATIGPYEISMLASELQSEDILRLVRVIHRYPEVAISGALRREVQARYAHLISLARSDDVVASLLHKYEIAP